MAIKIIIAILVYLVLVAIMLMFLKGASMYQMESDKLERMMRKMEIIEYPGRLPGLNEIIAESKKGRGKYQPYNDMKQEYTRDIAWLATKLPKYERINVYITWIEPNHRRDPDNIMSGVKFILDGLVMAGTIKNDGQKQINHIGHDFDVDKDNPRVVIKVEEAI